MDSTFEALIESVRIMEECIQEEGEHGWVDTSAAIELALSRMMPSTRKKLWNFLSIARKRMGNKIFEDEMDYATFAIKYDRF